MIKPCRKCKSVKVARLPYNFVRAVTKLFRLRLAVCANCGRWRVMPRGEMKRRRRANSQSPQLELVETSAPAGKRVEEIRSAKRTSTSATCPRCGSQEIRRSHRTFWENLSGSPPMMRCRSCRHRFPYEHDRVKAA